ncbi:hypothetical protein T484DRAFT_2343376 [Baffinella frigidus]|nr:hypothetical protein T484DRAFT_2343376 [Cryptophyta sp. CCMP2293]
MHYTIPHVRDTSTLLIVLQINNPKGPATNLVTRPLTQRDPNAGPRPQGAATSRTNPTRLTATTLPAIRYHPHPTTSKARQVPKQQARRSHAHHPQIPFPVPATEPPRPRGHPIWTSKHPQGPMGRRFLTSEVPLARRQRTYLGGCSES